MFESFINKLVQRDVENQEELRIAQKELEEARQTLDEAKERLDPKIIAVEELAKLDHEIAEKRKRLAAIKESPI